MVNGFTQYIEDTAQGAGADRNADRSACILCLHTAYQTVSGAHSNSTDNIVADMLHDLSGQMNLVIISDDTVDMDCVIYCRQGI